MQTWCPGVHKGEQHVRSAHSKQLDRIELLVGIVVAGPCRLHPWSTDLNKAPINAATATLKATHALKFLTCISHSGSRWPLNKFVRHAGNFRYKQRGPVY